MKILHIGDPAFVASELSKRLRQIEIKSDVLRKISISDFSNDNPFWIKTFKSRLNFLFFIIKNLKNYNIIHCHYLVNFPTLVVRIINKNIPIILHAHGSDTRPKNIFTKIVQRLVATKSSILLYSTPDLKNNLSWFKGKLIYLPNPVDVSDKIPRVKRYKNRILIFTTLNKVKKIEKIFGVIGNSDFIFDIVDFGPDKDYYKKIAPKNVNFIKAIKHENVKNELLKYHLVIGGSQDGVIRVCELEPMSLGIPTLFPFKYNHFYPEPLPMLKFTAENIKKYFGDYELGKKQREWVKKYHDVKVITNKLIKIYGMILNKSK